MIKLINNALAAANARGARRGAGRSATATGVDLDALVDGAVGASSGASADAGAEVRRRCASTTTRRCSSPSTCSRTCGCAWRRRRGRRCAVPRGRRRRAICWTAAMARGLGEQDFAAISRSLEGLAGRRIVAPAIACATYLDTGRNPLFCNGFGTLRALAYSSGHAARPSGSPARDTSSSGPVLFFTMPIAFKEWAVTVRALAEGEQLVTLRKGGIREPEKHFHLEHDRFFLYPTFDHQRGDLVRESHQPELRRALEEGVWADGEPPADSLRSTAASSSPIASASAPGPRSPGTSRSPTRAASTRSRPSTCGRPTTRRSAWRGSAGIRCTSLLLRTYRIPRPVTVKVKDEYGGCRSWLELQRDLPFEGTPVLSDDEFERAAEEICAIVGGRRARGRLAVGASSRSSARPHRASSSSASAAAVTVVGALSSPSSRERSAPGGRRRADLGAPGRSTRCLARGVWTSSHGAERSTRPSPARARHHRPGGFHFAESRLAGLSASGVLLVDPRPGPERSPPARRRRPPARLRPRRAARRRRRRPRPRPRGRASASPLADAVLLAAGHATCRPP